MSKRVGRLDQQPSAASETGTEALQSNSRLFGPTEPLDGHEDNDHFALIYEDQAEQLATVVPFVRDGLERGERCMYMVEDNSRDELVTALRDGGVDVDAALDAGQLSIHSIEETYLKGGEFDIDEARALLGDAMEEALADYEGFRVTAEETWLVGDETAQRDFMTCEAHVNNLIEGEAGMALCQYNRTELPPEVIEDVITTHPYLIYDDTVCPNDYYAPPEEFFGPGRLARDNDRKLETLVDRTDARASLQTRERFLREGYEITSDPTLSFDQKLQALFDLGCEQFGLDLGAMAEVDLDADRFEVEYVSDDHDHFEPGLELPLSETYCTAATDTCGVGSVDDPVEAGYDDIYVHNEFGIKAYLGTYIEVEGDLNRTFFFVSEEPRHEPFSNDERMFQRLLGQWVKYELERRQRERELRERKEHLSAVVETTPDCIKTVAADGTLLQMNPAGLDMVQADSASDVIGECVYDLIAPEHRETFREFNERICRGERETLEFDIVGLDGARRHMESHAAPLPRPDGTISHVALTRDITDRKEHEERLEQKNERLESFASMLAHELRNPVQIGQIYAHQLPADTDAEAVEYVTEAFDRIEDMIDIMLMLTRGQNAVGECTLVDLGAVTREVWDNVDTPDAALDVAIEREIHTDETYTHHLFRNLLENAVEHGGSDVTVTVGDLPTGFYVEDDGTGIPADERDAIFDEGYTTASDNGGTGLGLAFVRKLAEVYEWDCAVTESDAGGARFEFRNIT